MASQTEKQSRSDTRQQSSSDDASTQPRPQEGEAAQAWVRLAQLVRPQGRKGELLAEILTDFPERFSERRRLFLRSPSPTAEPRGITLQEYWLHKGRLVLKFAGVDSIEAADALRGLEVVIPRAERAPLEQGAVYIGDLVGCTLIDRATGAAVGEIIDVDRESSNMELIVVRQSSSSAELLVPFAKSYDPRIDLAARRMEMTLPDGLLSLNEPLTQEERRLAHEAQAADSNSGTGAPSPAQPRQRPKARKQQG